MDNNQQSSNAQQQQRRRGGFSSLFYVALCVLLLFVIIYATGGCGRPTPRGAFDPTFLRDIGYISEDGGFRLAPLASGETEQTRPFNRIAAVVQRGPSFYVLLHESVEDPRVTITSFRNNPTRQADYVFRFTAFPNEVTRILMLYRDWLVCDQPGGFYYQLDNHTSLTPDQRAERTLTSQIAFDDQALPTNWFSFGNILTVLSLVVLAFVAFLIFRSFSNRGGLGYLSKNRAQHTMGGAI